MNLSARTMPCSESCKGKRPVDLDNRWAGHVERAKESVEEVAHLRMAEPTSLGAPLVSAKVLLAEVLLSEGH